MDTTLIRPEKNLRGFLRIIGVFYSAKAIIFIFLPNFVFNYLSNLGWTVFNFPVPATVKCPYYVVHAVAFYMTLAFTVFFIQSNVIRRLDIVPIVIVAMFTSVVGFIVCFISSFYFIYLLDTVINGFIFLTLWYYYQKVYFGRIR